MDADRREPNPPEPDAPPPEPDAPPPEPTSPTPAPATPESDVPTPEPELVAPTPDALAPEPGLPPAPPEPPAESDVARPIIPPPPPPGGPVPIPYPNLGGFIGPSPSFAEVLGYLAAAFALVAWYVGVGSLADIDVTGVLTGFSRGLGDASNPIASAIPAAVLAALGLALSTRPGRGRRAAGVAFLSSTFLTAVAVALFVESNDRFAEPGVAIVPALAALAAATVFRAAVPSLLTQLGFLYALTSFAPAVLALAVAATDADGGFFGGPSGLEIALTIAWAALVAIGIGVLAEWEARRGAVGRAALARFWAGYTLLSTIAAIAFATAAIGSTATGVVLSAALLVASVVLAVAGFVRRSSAYGSLGAVGLALALLVLDQAFLVEAIGMTWAIVANALAFAGIAVVLSLPGADEPTPSPSEVAEGQLDEG